MSSNLNQQKLIFTITIFHWRSAILQSCIKQSIEEENEILFWCFSSAAVYNAVYPQDMYGFSALAFFLPEVINHKYCSLLPRTYKTQLDAAGPGELSVLLSLKGILGNT